MSLGTYLEEPARGTGRPHQRQYLGLQPTVRLRVRMGLSRLEAPTVWQNKVTEDQICCQVVPIGHITGIFAVPPSALSPLVLRLIARGTQPVGFSIQGRDQEASWWKGWGVTFCPVLLLTA